MLLETTSKYRADSEVQAKDMIESYRAQAEKEGYIMLDEYAQINNMSRSSASRELNLLTSDPTSGIKEKGRGSHKVWIASNEDFANH